MAGIVVNGEERSLDGVPLHTNLLDFVRACGLTGAKEGCAEGECGACSVLVARPSPDGSDTTEWTALNSCLVPAAALDGQEVVTAEGLGTPEHLHPVQHEMAVRGGYQCGYCTPGFVCSMAAEYYRADRPGHAGHFDIHALSGNLCRCTGYRPIKDAADALGAPDADDPMARRRTSARPRSPRHCSSSTTTRTPPSSPGAPTGASRSTCAVAAPGSWSPSTGSPSCGGSWSVTTSSGSGQR
jgi:xanthine dehydrogenase small subunit